MTFGVQQAADHLRDGTATARFIVFKMKIIVHCRAIVKIKQET